MALGEGTNRPALFWVWGCDVPVMSTEESADLSPVVASDITHPGGSIPPKEVESHSGLGIVRKRQICAGAWGAVSGGCFYGRKVQGKMKLCVESGSHPSVTRPLPCHLLQSVHAQACVYVHDHTHVHTRSSRPCSHLCLTGEHHCQAVSILPACHSVEVRSIGNSAPAVFLSQTQEKKIPETNTHISIPLRIPAFTSSDHFA